MDENSLFTERNEPSHLISFRHYKKHIDEGSALYTLLRQLVQAVLSTPEGEGDIQARITARETAARADALMAQSGIPAEYLLSGDEEELKPLMEKELIVPDAVEFTLPDAYDGGTMTIPEEENLKDKIDVLTDVVYEMTGQMKALVRAVGTQP